VGTLYAATVDGIYKSADHGESWLLISETLSGNQPVYNLNIDPVNPASVYAVAGGPPMTFWRSHDGGVSWEKASRGLPSSLYAQQLEVVPGAIYLVANGIYKSADGGSTWTLLSANLPAGRVVIDPRAPQRMYAGDYGFLKSMDEGRSWTRSSGDSAFGGGIISSIVIDPFDSSTIRAGLWVGAQSSIFKSVDAGETWSLTTGDLNLNGYGVQAITVVPNNSAILYASIGEPPQPSCCFEHPPYGGLFRSTDGGAWWIRLSDTGGYLILTDSAGRFLYTPADSGVSVYEVVEGLRVPVEGPIHHRQTIIRPLAGR
jgi:photosystem II stability/assembly factor-like uncharacterized protein